MRIGWDARILVNGQLRGMGSYAANLLPALRKCRPDLELRLYVDAGTRRLALSGFTAHRIGPERGYRWQLWERLGLPFHAFKDGCDILHSPANTTPPRCPIPRVVTLHDAMPFLPWDSNTGKSHYYRSIQRKALARADAIITVSEYSRRDICQALQVDPTRVVVIPNAGSPEIRRPDAATTAALLGALGVEPPFVLGLGAAEKRKNTIGILRAFAELQHTDRDTSLVLTGIGPALQDSLRKEIEHLRLPEARVHLLGFVELHELSALYAGCDTFLFLSLYEGFGIPILDAMQCGAPVVCSTRTSCPEVAGDAATFVDPEDPVAVAAAIGAIRSRSTEARNEWRRRGEARAATFSWQRTAERIATLYEGL